MYVGVGSASVAAADQARLYRTDDAVNCDRREFHQSDSSAAGVLGTEPDAELLW